MLCFKTGRQSGCLRLLQNNAYCFVSSIYMFFQEFNDVHRSNQKQNKGGTIFFAMIKTLRKSESFRQIVTNYTVLALTGRNPAVVHGGDAKKTTNKWKKIKLK